MSFSKPLAPTLGLVALGLGALGVYFAAEIRGIGELAFPLDDSWIHLQFASSLAAGQGLAYNPGEWVAGSTSPLWSALLSLGFLFAAPLFWPKILGAVCLLLSVLATAALGRAMGLGAGLSCLAAATVATSHWLLWSALSGMEIMLFTALAAWGLVFHLREEQSRCAGLPAPATLSIPVFALACLARPEGLLLLTLAVIHRFLRARGSAETGALVLGIRRRSGIPVIAALLAVAPAMLFYFWLEGSPAPTTLSAKVRPDLLPSGAYLRLVFDIFWRSQPVLVLLAGAGLVEAWRSRRPGIGLPALWFLGLPLAYSLLASPSRPMPLGNFGRYFLPMLPLLILFGLLGLRPLLSRIRGGVILEGRSFRLPLSALLLAGVLAPHFILTHRGPGRYVQTLANVQDSDVAAARWLAPRLPEDALIAVQDVGALKFLLPNRVVDLAGLVTPEVQAVLAANPDGVYWEERLARFLAEERVDYLVVFTDSYPALTRAQGFDRVASFAVPRNVTMAGDELVVLSTPWNDRPLIGQ
ncbi:MAG: hypothetical protein AAF725_00650 [Acidobacteriota bacterium]